MTALMPFMPLADWISEHLFEIHGIGLSGDVHWWIPLLCIAMLFGTFTYIGIPRALSLIFTGILGGVIILTSTSHGDPDVQAHSGLLHSIGFNWHVAFIALASLAVMAVMSMAAQDTGTIPGRFRSVIELLILFIRDEVVRPTMGKDGDNYLPTILSFFFFILTCNLLGLTPGSTTATGNIWVTGALAGLALTFYHGMGIAKFGILGYIVNLVPVHADMKRVVFFVGMTALAIVLAKYELISGSVQGALIGGSLVACCLFTANGVFDIGAGGSVALWLFMLVIELIGHVAKPFALMVRLFANMAGGHAVLYVMFGFTFIFKSYVLGVIVATPGSTAIMFLELLVACIQAYVFTMLTTVFLNGAVNPEH